MTSPDGLGQDLAESFVQETRELLEEANAALLTLERNPQDREAINALFRCVHSIKGAAGLFNLPALVHLVHGGEDLLGAMREGRVQMDPATADDLLEGLDHIEAWIGLFHADRGLPDDCMTVARRLAGAYRARLAADAPVPGHPMAAAPAGDGLPDWALAAAGPIAAAIGAAPALLVAYTPDEACFFSGDDPLRIALAMPGQVWMDISVREPWPDRSGFDPYACNLCFRLATTAPRSEIEHHVRFMPDAVTLVEVDAAMLGGAPATPATLPPLARDLLLAQSRALALPGRHTQLIDIEVTLRNLCAALGVPCPLEDGPAKPVALFAAIAALIGAPAASAGTPATPAAPPPAGPPDPAPEREATHDRTLRVEQAKVDMLMNLVGELVVAKNALPFLARDAEVRFGSRELSREIKDKYAVIDRITCQMQNAVMDIRMMPVSDLFKRFPRLVRDIARKQDKKVDLVIEGETTEADKNILEALAEPLTHVLRNSLDHGVCPTEERLARGKPPVATIRLSAVQEGDSVIITVSDDGRGIDPVRVTAKAIERGLIDEERAAQLSETQAVQLVFLPGFSTAEQISDLSGRGVGMDAVRTVVERLGGQVDLESRPGEGTRVSLRLPLSMAVTRVLTVDLAGQLYGVPMDVVVETVRIDPAQIRRFKASEAVFLRDSVVPIVRLRALLGMEPRSPALESILILRIAGTLVGLVIDDFGTGMDIILKPFSGILANMSGFSGTAVLGDGRVLLVLNLKEIL